jgi:type IV pilus assembly protein PilE
MNQPITTRNQTRSANRQRGFTLVELMVAVLVASILLAVAIPGYSTYVRKSRRTEAKTAVLDLASLEERYYSTQNLYTTVATNLGYAAFPGTVGSGYYQVTVTNVNAPTATAPGTYTITATPKAGTDQVKDTQCAQFQVTSTGVQSAKDSTLVTDTTATCWR